VRNIPDSVPTLSEVAIDFLAIILPQDKETTQIEVYKFIRWLGLGRKLTELKPVDVASYADQTAPSAIKPVKSFLSYIRKRGITTTNLSTHLRPKKAATKAVAFHQQESQTQATLTAQGYAELKDELAKLKKQRSQVIEEIRRAAADKDFRENAPLEAAREHKSHLEGRIKELESILKAAKITDGNQNSVRIKIGNTVVLNDLSSDKELRYILVDPRETNPAKGKVSTASPLGKTLLGKEKGQTVEFTAPAGIFSYRIEDVLP